MKKFAYSLCAVCLLAALVLPVSAREYETVEYEGETYIDVTDKADLDALVMEAWAAHEEHTNICYTVNDLEWDEWDYVDITTYSRYNTKGYFTFLEYSANCIYTTTVQKFLGPNEFTEKAYGTLDIEYLDNQEELAKADAIIRKVLDKIEDYTLYDKLLYIADYVCAATQYGSQELPGGGYDAINGAYDVLTGVRTNTVCTSYALTFQRFMEVLEVPSYLLSNVYHAWNVVRIDGNWYGVDCTADGGDTIDRGHFLMGLPAMKAYYSTDRLDPFALFAEEHTFATADYSKAAATTARPTTTATTAATTTTKPAATTVTATTTTIATTATTSTTEITTTAVTTVTTTAATDTTQSTTGTTTAPTVTVDLTEQATIEQSVFQEAAQQQTVLELKGKDYSWTFDGKELTEDSAPLDATIHLDEQVTESDRQQIAAAAETEDVVPFTFAHHGKLPGTAQISLQLEADYAGQLVGVYYLNDSGEAVLQDSATVSDTGVLTFSTDHCSLWFIQPLEMDDGLLHSTAADWLPWVIAGGAVLLVAAAVIVILLRRKTA